MRGDEKGASMVMSPFDQLLRGTGCIKGRGWVGWRQSEANLRHQLLPGQGGGVAERSRKSRLNPILDLGSWIYAVVGSRSIVSPLRPRRGEAWTTIILRLTYSVLRYTSRLQLIAQ